MDGQYGLELELAIPPHAKTAHTIRMLVLIADPLLMDRSSEVLNPIQSLSLFKELKVIADSCRQLAPGFALEIEAKIATKSVLRQTLTTIDDTADKWFDIIHFIGHGMKNDKDAALVLEDEDGISLLMKTNELRELMEPVRRTNEQKELESTQKYLPCLLMTLNAFYTQELVAVLQHQVGIPFVIFVNAEDTVLDEAARIFAMSFYPKVLSGERIGNAFAQAKATLYDSKLVSILDRQNHHINCEIKHLPGYELLNTQTTHGKVQEPNKEGTNLNIINFDPFMGRRTEIRKLARFLRDIEKRCIAIHGLPGMGKTSLAEAAGRWQYERRRWTNGVWIVYLRNVTTISEARMNIATIPNLKLPTKAAESNSALIAALGDRHILLILDDLDALLKQDRDGVATLLLQLLHGCSNLRLLITSQESLPSQIVYQYEYLQHMNPTDARETFQRAPWPNKRLSGTLDQESLEELLTLLDGYPLAIRLAAMHMEHDLCDLPTLCQRLKDKKLEILRDRERPKDRDASVEAALKLSYDALPTDEAKDAFSLLALFPAGLSRDTAFAILGESYAEALTTLRRFSMTEYHELYNRYALPEPARWFAEECLKKRLGSREHVLEQYAPKALKYFDSFVRGATNMLTRKEPSQHTNNRWRLTLEQPNLYTFLEWGYKYEQREECYSARITAELTNYWRLTAADQSEEALPRLDQALKAARRNSDQLGKAMVHRAIGNVQQRRNDLEAAIESYHEALELYLALDRREDAAALQELIGDVQQLQLKLEATLVSYQKALSLYLEINNRRKAAYLHRTIGDIKQSQNEMEAALVSYENALSLYDKKYNQQEVAYIQKSIGDIQYGRLRQVSEAALASYLEALSLYQKIPNQQEAAHVQRAIGDIHRSLQRLEIALVSYRNALSLYKEAEDELSASQIEDVIDDIRYSLRKQAQRTKEKGDRQSRQRLNEALESYAEAVKLYSIIEDKLEAAHILKMMGDIQQSHQEFKVSFASYREALSLYQEANNNSSTIQISESVNTVRHSLDAVRHSLRELARRTEEDGDHLQSQHKLEVAMTRYQEAVSLYRDLGDEMNASRIQRIIDDILSSNIYPDQIEGNLSYPESIQADSAISEKGVLSFIKVKLREQLNEYFNESEIRDLCFDLSIDYDSLEGRSKQDKARELVAYCQRHGRILELYKAIRERRPKAP